MPISSTFKPEEETFYCPACRVWHKKGSKVFEMHRNKALTAILLLLMRKLPPRYVADITPTIFDILRKYYG